MKFNKNTTAAVIGHPIKHSRSPLIHNHWLEQAGIDGRYEALDIAPENLADFCKFLRSSALKGINVTLPHKQAIMEYCDELDDTALKIGALNTISVKDGKLYGTNTDAYGFIQNLKIAAPDFDFTQSPAVVLGAGGAARAVLYGLLEEGVPHIVLTNRTQEKAEALAADFPDVQVMPWAERANVLAGCRLLVNTTSLGMEGKPPLDLDLMAIQSSTLVTDLIYNPLQTNLLQEAACRGCTIVGGLGMLVYQAEKSFEIWFNQKPEIDAAFMEKLQASL